MLIAVGLLAMALAAAAGNRGDLLLIAAGVCAAVAIFGLLAFQTTSRRDRLEHHERPHLLDDSYVPTPPWRSGTRGEADPRGR
ncbi:hypothetical protein BJY24_005943 [Nocardia transvalensis]|uniref:Uncharacterized protein n=1 Tax=Nocardia transvalensis TaxID=37333 RepID=A0A7W9PJ89_9NOCA|nr:hypothetical protein [Nocardia transvalensis]MBB5917031.1 hypothetical protein [Nocardia transvalensis]